MTEEKMFQPLSGWFPLSVCLALLVGGPVFVVFCAVVLPEAVAVIAILIGVLAALSGSSGVVPADGDRYQPGSGSVAVRRLPRFRYQVRLLLGEPFLLEKESVTAHP